MERLRLTLGNGSHYGPSSRMRNTSDQLRRTCRSLGPCRGDCCSAKYIRNNVSSPGGSAGVGGVGSLFTASDNNSLTNLSLGDSSGASPGEGPLESVLPTISLTVLHSDQPGCSVY